MTNSRLKESIKGLEEIKYSNTKKMTRILNDVETVGQLMHLLFIINPLDVLNHLCQL